MGLPKKTDRPAPPEPNREARIMDSVYTCPLSVYIDATVDDKLEGLIISGSPTRGELEEAKMKLVSEFAEITGGGEMKAYNEVVSSYYKQSVILTGFETAFKLISAGRFNAAIEFLNRNGVKCSIPENGDGLSALVKTVELKYKNRLAKFKEISGRYEASSSKRSEKPTRRYYSRLTVMLSTCEVIKLQLNPKTMTVAEFAEYPNTFTEYQNQLKMKKNGSKYGNNR